jgi:phosphatidylinositol 4-kinase B
MKVKDRHNGNILLDEAGHIVHIDFGFLLGDSPAFNINFESAPFKLTAEYVELLGGLESPFFRLFEELFVQGYRALQQHADSIVALVEVRQG